jgi:preprotein translocase subunit YajC
MCSGNNSYDHMLRDLNILFAKRGVQTSAFTIAILVIGVIGNVIVLLTYWRLYKHRSKQFKDRDLMLHLALMDLIACVFGCSKLLYIDFNPLTFTSNIICRVLIFTAWSTNAVSVLMLLVISVNRYLKICRPTQQQMTCFGRGFR